MITSLKHTVQLLEPGKSPEETVNLELEIDFDFDMLSLIVGGQKFYLSTTDLLAVSAAVQAAYAHYRLKTNPEKAGITFPQAIVDWAEPEPSDSSYGLSPNQLDAIKVLNLAKAASDCPGNIDPSLIFKALVQVVFGTINWS